MKTEMSILEELGASLAPTHEQPPAEVRHRVMNGMRRRRPAGVRLAWRIGAPSVAAAAVAAALVAGQLADIAKPAPPGPGAPVQVAPQGPPDAGQVLLLAAQHAAGTPAMAARPHQFLYVDSVEVESRLDRTGNRATVTAPLRTRTWLSVDGTRDGLVVQDGGSPPRTTIDGCTNGRQAQTIDRPETTPQVACTPQPAYQPGRIPTDPAGLLAHVYKVAAAEPEWVTVNAGKGFVRISADQRAFTEIAQILDKNHLPAVQEAAFRAAGRIPGVQVRRNVVDAAGRVGVAVTRTEAGNRYELIFDPATYRYLGLNIIGAAFDPTGAQVVSSPDKAKGIGRVRLGPDPKPGEVIHKSALLRVAVVDKVGERPSA
jgi:hypothetical protein